MWAKFRVVDAPIMLARHRAFDTTKAGVCKTGFCELDSKLSRKKCAKNVLDEPNRVPGRYE